jgi:hypothetical protein
MPCKSLPDVDLEAKMPQQTPYSFQFQKHLLPPEERNGIDNEIRLFHMVEMVRTMSWSDGEFQVRFMIRSAFRRQLLSPPTTVTTMEQQKLQVCLYTIHAANNAARRCQGSLLGDACHSRRTKAPCPAGSEASIPPVLRDRETITAQCQSTDPL